MTSPDPMLALRNDYLGFVTRAGMADFRPLPTSGPATLDPALFASVAWCREIFRDAVHGPGDQAQHSYHVATATLPADLLLHRLTVGAVAVRVYEGAAFFAVLMEASYLRDGAPMDKATQAANLLLALDDRARFIPLEPQAPRSFSTGPELAAEGLGDWKQRIDAVILDDKVVLIVYKITYDDMMTLVSDPRRWFRELRSPR